MNSFLRLTVLVSLSVFQFSHVRSFVPQRLPAGKIAQNTINNEKWTISKHATAGTRITPFGKRNFVNQKSTWSLFSANDDQETNNVILSLSTSDQVLLGGVGTFMSTVMLYSEFVLKTTGCGLPAGPFGLIGATEGISYLGVSSLFLFSLYSKIKTGSGLPAGPKGILGLAEGLSFLAVFSGLIVLGFQVFDFGYIPNAVPMEGGMCS